MEKVGLTIGILGGIGLGLLLGSEFTSRYITIIGAILVIFSIISLIFLSYKEKK